MCYLQLQIDVSDDGVPQVPKEAEEDDDVGDFEAVTEDTDEEYMPVAEPSSLTTSTSAARRRMSKRKTNKKENGEAVEEDSKKGYVQCPVCNKSFKSKYYLKVHNRYTTSVLFLEITAERVATHVSFS